MDTAASVAAVAEPVVVELGGFDLDLPSGDDGRIAQDPILQVGRRQGDGPRPTKEDRDAPAYAPSKRL